MIKILFLAANPVGTNKLAIDSEVRWINDRLQKSRFADAFEIITQWAVRTSDLTSVLIKTRPDIVHFSGHGDHSGILLEDHQGKVNPVPPEALAKLFSTVAAQVKCVILNSCFSESQAKALANAIPAAIIGMNDAIADESAIVFAASFYESLSLGLNVAKSYEVACINIQIERRPGHDTPQLIAVNVDPTKIEFSITFEPVAKDIGTGKLTDSDSRQQQDSTTKLSSNIHARPAKDPSGLFTWALSHVPELKYGLGVAGLVALIAIIRSWGIEPSLAAVGVVVMLILMVGLLLFTRLDKASSRHIQLPMLALLYAFTLIIIAVASFLFTAVFFGWPTIRTHPFSDSSKAKLDAKTPVPPSQPELLDASVPPSHNTNAQDARPPSPAELLPQPETQQATIRIKAFAGKSVSLYRNDSVVDKKIAERWLKALPTGNLPDGSGVVFRLNLHPGLYRIRCSGGFGTSDHQIQIKKGKDNYEAECDHP